MDIIRKKRWGGVMGEEWELRSGNRSSRSPTRSRRFLLLLLLFYSTALRKIKEDEAKETQAQNCLPTFLNAEGAKLIEK